MSGRSGPDTACRPSICRRCSAGVPPGISSAASRSSKRTSASRMSAVAIITARGGSKRIPRKNLRPFLGRPIIAYSIEAALQSGLFDEVMVSTDDDEIAEIARTEGAAVPFRRSADMADDYATTADVLREVLAQYGATERSFDVACCLYPTAPFVTAERLRAAFARLTESGAHTVIPVTRFAFPIWRAFYMD